MALDKRLQAAFVPVAISFPDLELTFSSELLICEYITAFMHLEETAHLTLCWTESLCPAASLWHHVTVIITQQSPHHQAHPVSTDDNLVCPACILDVKLFASFPIPDLFSSIIFPKSFFFFFIWKPE